MHGMRKTAPYLLGVWLALLTVFFAHSTASAANMVLTITPTTVQTTINPGATTNGSFQVINDGQDSYSVHVYAAPYSVKSEQYTPDFQPVPGKPIASDWLRFSVSQGQVQPKQSLTVQYSLTVPKDVQPGGYY